MKKVISSLFLLVAFSSLLMARPPRTPDTATRQDRWTPGWSAWPNFEWIIVRDENDSSLSYRERALIQHRRYKFLIGTSEGSRALVYGEREYGINLVWGRLSDDDSLAIAFKAPGVEPGEAIYPSIRSEHFWGTTWTRDRSWSYRVAIHVGGGSYLCYGYRSYGIDLVWRSSPCYEWELRQVSEESCPEGLCPSPEDEEHYVGIGWDRPIGLYNRVIGKYLVFGEREYGINLVWRNP